MVEQFILYCPPKKLKDQFYSANITFRFVFYDAWVVKMQNHSLEIASSDCT